MVECWTGTVNWDRERQEEDRGRQDGVESGDWGVKGGTERKRRWPRALRTPM
jgi:hypothetical protein